MLIARPHRAVVCATAASAAVLLFPASSPAADQIAYNCNDDLCLVDPDSASPVNLTNTAAAQERIPSWSPDGTRLSYTGFMAGNVGDIFTLAIANPGTATNVSQTSGRYEGFGPAEWSPGGGRIVYESDPVSGLDTLGSEAYVSPPDGTAAPQAAGSSTSDESDPTWSPDGTKVAFTRNSSAIWTANADGSGTAAVLPNSGGGYQPDWSADGTRIAFVTTGGAVRAVRVDGTGTPAELGSTTGFIVQGPFFSPDSSRVMWKTQNTIYIRAADGTGPTTPITVPNGMPGYPMSWSPNSARIAFSGFDASANIHVFVANANGTGTPVPVGTVGATNIDPTWKPDPNAQLPGEPPVSPTRPPVTISLASFANRPVVPFNNFVRIGAVNCVYPSPSNANPHCRWDPDGVTKSKTSASPVRALLAAKPKGKTVRLPGVRTELAYGESGQLRLKLTKAAKKALKPGKTYKLQVKVAQTIGTDPVVTTKKTLKLKMPKKKG